MSHSFHNLTVAGIRNEIGGLAKSVTFEVPPSLKDQFIWKAGQHLTVRFSLDQEEERRSYTISNPPGDALRITVKRVRDGIVSNHICDTIQPGDQLEVMAPTGGFVLQPDPNLQRTHFFFGAGSGITPLYAMIRTVLSREPHSVAHLIFGNTNANTILLNEELEKLATAFPDRFHIRHILSAPSFLSWFSPWRSGRIDAAALSAAFAETPPVAQDVQYWLCGPGVMNADVKSALMSLDVPANRIHMESFGSGALPDTSITGVAATAHITLNGKTHEVAIAKDQTVLSAMQDVGLEPPYSCQSGVCGACRAHLTDGQADMRARMALEDDEISKGEILTCQAVAQSETLSVTFPG